MFCKFVCINIHHSRSLPYMKRLLPIVLMLAAILPANSVAAVKREMRSAWLATVWGIDWPSVQGVEPKTIARQKAELRDILDRLKKSGLNAVNFQVRSMCDAMYRSRLEPWSRFLTGERGKAPLDKTWDPLRFCVDECHKRGMECHAWVNPFRFAGGALPATASDMKLRRKGWVLTYSRKERQGRKTVDKSVSILDPGNKDARDYIVAVCREIVTGYDIDGLVFDDYFYPEGMPLGGGYDYDEWKKDSGGMSQDDWRRDNVRRTVAQVYRMIQKEKPFVKFGISPAGVGGGNGKASSRYGLSPSYVGNDWMYDGIYCDPLAWLEDGSVDYVSPQIYWACDHATNAYEPIARWWSEVASHFGRHFYPSHSLAGTAGSDVKATVDDRLRQIAINRDRSLDGAPGAVFYSVKHLVARGLGTDVASRIASAAFPTRALTPAMTWKPASDPGIVDGIRLKGRRLSWEPKEGMRYTVYAVPATVGEGKASDAAGWGISADYLLDVSYESHYDLPPGYETGYWYAVAPYDRCSNEWNYAACGAPDRPEEPFEEPLLAEIMAESMNTEPVSAENVTAAPDCAETAMALSALPEYAEEGIVPQAEGYEIDLGCEAESARLFDASGALVARGRGVRRLKAPGAGSYVLRMVDASGNTVTRSLELPVSE